MAQQKRGLGKGLGALIPTAPAPVTRAPKAPAFRKASASASTSGWLTSKSSRRLAWDSFIRRPKVAMPADNIADDTTATPRLWEVARFLWTQHSFRWIALGCSLTAFGGYANLYFIPKFLIVSHHMTPIQVGIALSLLVGVFGAIGTFASGVIADRMGRRNVNWYMWVPILSVFIAVPCGPVFFLYPNTTVALCAACATRGSPAPSRAAPARIP